MMSLTHFVRAGDLSMIRSKLIMQSLIIQPT